MRTRASLLLAAAVVVPMFVVATPAGAAPVSEPASAAVASSTAVAVLSALPAAAPTGASYSRNLFTHWIDADGDGCDTRQEILIAESKTPAVVSGACSVVSGEWFSWYDGATWTNPSDVDVDHFVPLAEAWRSGADSWTPAQRQAFANDLEYDLSLVAATDSVNSSKSDNDPSTWLPPITETQCDYASDWVLVKYKWGLGVDSAERSALSGLLAGACGSAVVQLPAVAVGASTTNAVAPASSPVYRFWSPTFQGHFFTMDATERDLIMARYPASIWTYEGERYQAFSTQIAGTVPLHRFWSAKLNGHFFTTNEAEKDSVIAIYDDFTWTYEGVAYYVYPVDSAVAGTSAVARFWSPTYQHHFYTANADEAVSVKRYPLAIWTFEGDDFRVPTTINPAPPGLSNPGNTKNCTDFADWQSANAWFQTYLALFGDVAGLDADFDGVPCETLPGAP
jgi:hypothetical protein